MYRNIFLLVTFFCCSVIFAQQQFSFRQLTVKEGLSQNSVVSIAQDSLGFLWLATQDGLNKYDGRDMRYYPFQFTDITRPTFSRLGKVFVDRRDKVWIIPSDHRLYSYDRAQDGFEVFDSGAIDGVSTIWQHQNGTYWIGTLKGEAYAFNEQKKLKKIPFGSGIKSPVKKIGELTQNKIYVLSEKSLVQIDTKSNSQEEIVLETLLGETPTSSLSTALIDNRSRVWLGYHGDGLFYLDSTSNSLVRLRDAGFEGYLPENLIVLDLFQDENERIWIATYGRGLYMIDFRNAVIRHFTAQKQNPKALHYNDILCIYQDDSNTLWYGTDGAGASFYDEYLEKFNSFINYQTPRNISIDVVRALTLDKEDGVWIGTSGKGLTHYEPKYNSWTTFTTANSAIPSNRVMSLLHDADGDLWIGTQGAGLSILHPSEGFGNFSSESNPPLTSKTIWEIFEDSNKNIWLGTRDDGLIAFDKNEGVIKKYRQFSVGDSTVVRENIRVITEDRKGNLWLGTDNQGLVKFNPSSGHTLIFMAKDVESIASNNIKSLYYDSNDLLWIGTSGAGLSTLDTKTETFYTYSMAHGLPNNVIYAILPDGNGNLWLSSNKGITQFVPPRTFADSPSITNYDNYDGLATEFNTGAYYRHSNGQLYFGGLEGFYWFDPQSISQHQYLPQTAITEYRVLNETKSVYTDTLLRFDQNTIDFSFSSLQFSEPGKNRYKYRLLPYEKEWVPSGNKNFVRYTHLPPNDYEFQVVSSNYDGKWNNTPEKFAFTVTPSWYFNTWSKLLYVLLLLLLALGVYRYLKWRWKMQLNLRLKEEEATRFKALNDYRSKIYTDIAHEFRTPLTLISGPVESKLSEPDISETDFSNFSMIERNASRLTNLVDQLLQLAKLEEGKLKLNKERGNLGLFLKSLASSFEYEANQKSIAYSYKIDDMQNVIYDEDVMDKIVANLLSNAIKHGKRKGKCHFEATHADGFLNLIIINDTEKTIVDVQKLFERFYQTDTNAKGAGIGLSLVHELVKLSDGKIRVDQTATEICFRVKMPLAVKDSPQFANSNGLETKRVTDDSKEEKPMVLVVEDNTDVRTYIKTEFKKSFKVVEASNGEIGIKRALKYIPDIVISDVRMPIKDGIELCNSLKTDERTSHIPIVLLTASDDKQNELRGLKAGADDYVTKPFKIKILEKRVANLVKSRKMLRERYSQENFLRPKELAITPTDEAFLNKVQSVMDEHMADPEFNAAKFCKLIGMSRMQLHRKLQAYTGLSTSAFIRSQRLKQALHILETSDATVNEIAYTVGFNTPSYFIKCFKETYKKTPAEFLQAQ